MPFRQCPVVVRQRALARKAMLDAVFSAEDEGLAKAEAIERGRAAFFAATGATISIGTSYFWLKVIRERGGRKAPLSAYCTKSNGALPGRVNGTAPKPTGRAAHCDKFATAPLPPSRDAVQVVIGLRRQVQAGGPSLIGSARVKPHDAKGRTWQTVPPNSRARALDRIAILAVVEAAILCNGGVICAAVEAGRAASVAILGKVVSAKCIHRWRAAVARAGDFWSAPDVSFVDRKSGARAARKS